MPTKNTHIYFETIAEMFENSSDVYDDVLKEHKKSNEQLSEDNKIKIKGELFEIFANSHCFEKAHLSLISTHKKIHGYDGIYLNKNNNIYFMEAKYHKKKFNDLLNIADKTILKKLKSRTHEIDNSRNALKDAKTNSKTEYIFTRENYMTREKKKIIIKIDDNLTNSIKKLDKYFESISSEKSKHIIDDADKVFYLANNEEGDQLSCDHEVREVICVTIREEKI